MRVLRPNGVSTGWTLRQLETTPQSPQPSQTASLIITRDAGVTARLEEALEPLADVGGGQWLHGRAQAQRELIPIGPPPSGVANGG